MLIRPDRRDLRVIGFNIGRIITGLGLVMLLPMALGLLRREWDDAFGLGIGAGLALLLGQVAERRLQTRQDMDWTHALVVVSSSWLIASYLGAVPLYLSGHFASFLDAYFDAMSGFATAGLSVINDLDHLSDSINLWRHLMHFLGGQGLVLVALSVFAGGGGLTGLYIGEAREDRIMPNVHRTARFIWKVALLYGAVGTMALWWALLHAGMPLWSGLFHAANLFMAAFDTGGFAPTSGNLGFYHSAAVEGVTSVLMIAGALSFALHHRLMERSGAWPALTRTMETRFLALSVTTLFAFIAVGLATAGTYTEAGALYRRGFFHLLSAHTGTGFGTIPGRLFITDWGALAPAVIVLAMALGGMAGSTTGGIKALRVGILFKAITSQVRRVLLPADAVLVDHYRVAGVAQPLRQPVVVTAVVILLLYVILYFAGFLLGLLHGYTVQEALFESTSAAAAVGLSIGMTSPSLEPSLKVMYIFQMWIGRLEFVSVFALFGYALAAVRGRT